MDCPAHLVDTHQLFLLRRVANWAAGFFGGPVYLTGGALREGNSDPRDWDLRCIIPDKAFVARWKPRDGRYAERWAGERQTGSFSRETWAWCDDMRHHSETYTRNTDARIDFQVYPESYAEEQFPDFPRFRLDTRDDPNPPRLVLAGEDEVK